MKKFSAVAGRIDKIFEFIEKYISASALIAFTFITFINVVGRKFFFHSLTWAEESSRYLNMWMVYLCISAGIKYNSHIGVDAIVELLIPKKFRKPFIVLMKAIVVVFCVVVTYLGILMVQKVAAMHQLSAALRLPMYVPYLAIPVGMAMASVRSFIQLIESIARKNVNSGNDTEALGNGNG